MDPARPGGRGNDSRMRETGRQGFAARQAEKGISLAQRPESVLGRPAQSLQRDLRTRRPFGRPGRRRAAVGFRLGDAPRPVARHSGRERPAPRLGHRLPHRGFQTPARRRLRQIPRGRRGGQPPRQVPDVSLLRVSQHGARRPCGAVPRLQCPAGGVHLGSRPQREAQRLRQLHHAPPHGLHDGFPRLQLGGFPRGPADAVRRDVLASRACRE